MTYQALPSRIVAQARASGSATAVVEGARELSYRGLDASSAALAARLRAAGIGAEDVVGVLLPRSLELVVTLLAIGRAGAAYVPLDPEHPQERTAWILGDTQAKAVVTTPGSTGVPAGFTGTVIEVEEPGNKGPEQVETAAGDQPADPPGSPEAAAYVLYTSGSTGRPKGVIVTRRGIANYVDWKIRTHGFGPGDRILQRTSPAFDAAGWELFAPLASGATMVLAPHGADRDPAAVLETVIGQGVTVLQVVPSILRLLTARPEWALCTGLRLLLSGGEALRSELLESVKAEVWNTYGPTECTIDVAAHRFDPAADEGPVPIGRPVDGDVLYVLDAAGRPAPIGVPGELYVGGAGLARGYLGRPDLTAQRFVPAPFGPPGARLYRTGDRVRWNEDHELEYLGRLDRQVKVNGVRIEPGEVEAALSRHPEVTAAVVDAYPGPDGQGGSRLTAHYTGGADPAELRAFLGGVLPRTLVPALLLPIAEIPLLASGKPDRAALAAHAAEASSAARRPGRAASDAASDAALTGGQEAVAAVWGELLGVARLAAEDDFFHLGGHSLLVPRLADLLHAATGRRFALRDLYTATTIAAQARLLAAGTGDCGTAGAEDAAGNATSAAAGAGAAAAPAVAGAIAAVPTVEERDRDLPTTAAQRRLWFLDRLVPESLEYHVPVLIRLGRRVEEGEVHDALAGLAERHEVLRTRYPAVDGRPVQRIDADGVVPLDIAPSPDLGTEVRRQLRIPFDLENGPVWRASLVREEGPDASDTLVLCLHHIACDGWSVALLERDVRALMDGRELPAPAVQYADFAAWQAARHDDDGARRDLGYWLEALDGIGPLDLPTDRPRPPMRDAAGAMVTFRVGAETVGLLENTVGRERGATLFMTLVTAYATLLGRFGGGWDVPVGIPVAGRSLAQVRDTVGLFLNTLVLRCGLDPEEEFSRALERIRPVVLGAFAHQETPFDELVERLEPGRDLSRTPLYQAMFDLQEGGITAPTADRGVAQALSEAWRTAKTDLTMILRRGTDGSLFGVLEYATALFDRETAESLARCYVNLLDCVAADPGRRLDLIGLVGADKREELLALTRGPVAERPPETCLDLFDRAVADRPRSPAVFAVDHGGELVESLDYLGLSALADRFAARLRDAGVGREQVVGVLLERGAALAACLLGIWRAGAAYLPLDPAQPAERMRYVLQDARASAVVCTARYREVLGQVYQGPAICLDDAASEGALPLHAAAAPAPGELAYVLYTSGSTGRPKGVRVAHAALVNTLLSLRETFACGPGDRWLAQTPMTFDISAVETILPLTSGAATVLAPAGAAADGAALCRIIERHAVTHVQATPSGWRLLLRAGLPERAARVRGLTGGETVPADLTRELRERLRELVIGYGPTEATVIATVWPVPPGADPDGRALIGRPIENCVAYVLDAHLTPVAPGMVGELYVGGAGLARGYQDPSMTARAYVPDPYGPPGSRLYRTGDLVRVRAEGTLEFRGRTDTQMKVNGYRVEAGEIEAVLGAHPEVRTAVVTLRASAPSASSASSTSSDVGVVRGEPGQPRLAAYYVPESGPQPAAVSARMAVELAQTCRARLPEYMVPVSFTPIEAVPVTAHGKIDYSALPDPVKVAGGATATAGRGNAAPVRGAVAENVARLWAGVLGEDHGDDAVFFRSGGDSLLAVHLAERLGAEYGIEFPVREVFLHPTIPGLAAEVELRVAAQIEALSEQDLLALAAELDAPPASCAPPASAVPSAPARPAAPAAAPALPAVPSASDAALLKEAEAEA